MIMTVINGKRKRINTCSAAVLCYVQCRSFGIKTTACRSAGARAGTNTSFGTAQKRRAYIGYNYKINTTTLHSSLFCSIFSQFQLIVQTFRRLFVSLFNLQPTFNLQLPSTSSRWVTIFMYSVFSYASLSFNFRISGHSACHLENEKLALALVLAKTWPWPCF